MSRGAEFSSTVDIPFALRERSISLPISFIMTLSLCPSVSYARITAISPSSLIFMALNIAWSQLHSNPENAVGSSPWWKVSYIPLRGRFKRAARLCASVFVLMLVYPNLIYSDNDVREFWTDYFSFHSVVCNGLVALAFVLIVSLRLYEPDPSGEHGLVLLFALGFCGLSATMAHFLRVNLHGHHIGNTAMLEDMRRSAQSVFGMGMSQMLLALAVAMLHNLLPNLMDRFHYKHRMALKGR